jgi:hypothetical protein
LANWIQDGDYQNPTPFLDAMHQLYALEESHRVKLGENAYFAVRDASAEGRTVGGMIYARGLITHRAATTVAVIGGRPFTVGRSMIGGRDQIEGKGVSVIWRMLAELPLPGRPERHSRDTMYDDRVAGRDVLDTFGDVDIFLASLP